MTTATVPDDRPVRVEQRRLRRPAGWAIVVGALSPPALVVGALGLSPDAACRAATVLGFAGGVFACVWLVRLQRFLARTGLLRKPAPEFGLWVMWALPFLCWVLPAVRISRLDVAAHGRRSWVVFAWAGLWIPLTMPGLAASA